MENGESENYDLLVMLEEAQKSFDAQVRSIDILRDHAKTMLGVSSLLVSLFTTFGITDAEGDLFLQNLYTFTFLLIAGLYVLLVIMNLDAVLPEKIYRPIEPSEEEYGNAFFEKSKEDIIQQRISNYLNVIKLNREIIARKTKNSQRITGLFAAIFVLIVFISVIRGYS